MARRTQEPTHLGVSEFKRRCLELLESTRRTGCEFVITKRGRPIARVVPLRPAGSTARGRLRGQAEISGEIVEVDWSDEWDALG